MLPSRKLLCLWAAGPAGCGKSALIEQVVAKIHRRPELNIAPMHHLDGDFYHTRASVERMSAGIGLTDREREDWLERVAAGVATLAHQQHSAMVACSLLKPEYRQRMLQLFPITDLSYYPYRELEADSWVIWLDVDPDVLYGRVKLRYQQGRHWFPPSLVEKQLEAASQKRDGRTYIGPVPGEERNVIILKPTLGPPEMATVNAGLDAERVLREIIPGY